MDKCTDCAGGPETEVPGGAEEYAKYGTNRMLKGSAAVRRNVLDEVASCRRRRHHRADYLERGNTRGYASGAWGWMTAYHEGITV